MPNHKPNLSRTMRTYMIIFAILSGGIYFSADISAQSGSGTYSDPYVISSVAHFRNFQSYVNNGNTTYIGSTRYWRLNVDISWSEGNETQNRIGTNSRPFSGVFDGNGHTITVSYMSAKSTDYLALFATAQNATFRNLTVKAHYIDGRDDCGILIGRATGTVTIENVHVSKSTYNDIYGHAWGAMIGQIGRASCRERV